MNYLTISQVQAKLGGISKPTIYRLVDGPEAFPAPIKLGARSMWSETSIDKWMAKMEREAAKARRAAVAAHAAQGGTEQAAAA